MARYSKTPPPPRITVSRRRRPVPIAPPRTHAARRRLSPEQIAELVERYRQGESTNDLMRSSGLGRGTVLSLLEEAGVAMRNQGVPEDQVDVVVALYASGQSCATIGERYGCGAETVRQLLKRTGVTLRKPWEGHTRRK